MKGEELKKAFLKINVPENLPEEILISAAKSAAVTKKERTFMSKRTILAAAAIVAVLGVGIFAAVKNAVSIGVHSSSNPDYTSLPAARYFPRTALSTDTIRIHRNSFR